jgi:hypothetical protein
MDLQEMHHHRKFNKLQQPKRKKDDGISLQTTHQQRKARVAGRKQPHHPTPGGMKHQEDQKVLKHLEPHLDRVPGCGILHLDMLLLEQLLPGVVTAPQDIKPHLVLEGTDGMKHLELKEVCLNSCYLKN